MNFLSPTTIVCTGGTGSGKSVWLARLLKEKLFAEPPKRVVYCYGVWQSLFDTMENVEFVEGVPASFDEYADGNHNIIILDDLQDEVTNSKEVEHLFTRGSHHKKLTIIYLNQNLFYQNKHARTLALNTHYTVLFRNPRSASQIRTLRSQTGLKHLADAYSDATKDNFGYLVVDLHPASNQDYRLRSRIFQGEDPTIYK